MFALGQTVRIAPGVYHGAQRPAFATITGEGPREDTYRVIRGEWHMTYHGSELDPAPACDMPDGCGARAGETCEPGCPSLATD